MVLPFTQPNNVWICARFKSRITSFQECLTASLRGGSSLQIWPCITAAGDPIISRVYPNTIMVNSLLNILPHLTLYHLAVHLKILKKRISLQDYPASCCVQPASWQRPVQTNATSANNSQHCCGSMQTDATSPNIVGPNNVGCRWPTVLGPFAWALRSDSLVNRKKITFPSVVLRSVGSYNRFVGLLRRQLQLVCLGNIWPFILTGYH